MKVGVVGLYTNQNVGDYLLVECTKYLLKRISPDITIRAIDVDPRDNDVFAGRRKINLRVFDALRRNKGKAHTLLPGQYFRYAYDYFTWWIKVNWFYRREIKDLDCIIVAGGGFIKFRTQGLNYLDEQILKIANERGIPVMFNAVGIEGYDQNDVRCRRLKRALHLGAVKMITTRDDIDTLRQGYLDSRSTIVSAAVGDPVLWLREMLSGAQPRTSATGRIGINLVNPNNFAAYGGTASSLRVENFFKKLLEELMIAGGDFYLFTNGMLVDHKFGQRLLTKMNIPKSRLLPRPTNSDELVALIQSFDTILAARMHAGIVAHALDVPKLGLIWSEKIAFFAEQVNERQSYYSEDELDAPEIARRLMAGDTPSPDPDLRENLKVSTMDALAQFISTVSSDRIPA